MLSPFRRRIRAISDRWVRSSRLKPARKRVQSAFHDFARPSEELTIGNIVALRYEVLRKLGFGTTATVWLVRELRHVCTKRTSWIMLAYAQVADRKDAVPVQRPDGLQRAVVLELLGHSVVDLIEERGFYWEIRHKHSPLSSLRRIVTDMATAVEFVHAKGIIHRDCAIHARKVTGLTYFRYPAGKFPVPTIHV
ncbi:hypothetical protein MRB53_038286 [Persea americana]|nr:hypothetical protein MRB53_038286 [Persea americana]